MGNLFSEAIDYFYSVAIEMSSGFIDDKKVSVSHSGDSVHLLETPRTIAHQTLLSRKECWSK